MTDRIFTIFSSVIRRISPGMLLAVWLGLAVVGCVPASQANQQDVSGLDQAATTLKSFLEALHSGGYDEAATLYGGGYELLQAWNPEVLPDDHAALLEHGCMINGLQCLELRQINSREQLDAHTFHFEVQFTNPDGSLFRRGPCCGATEAKMPTQVSFSFTVQRQDEHYYILDLPPYVP